jgi:hypothetical protein
MKILLFIIGISLQTTFYSQDIMSDQSFGLSKSVVLDDLNSQEGAIVLPSKNSKIVTYLREKDNTRITIFFDSNFEAYKHRLPIYELDVTKNVLRKRYRYFNAPETKYWSNTQKVEIINKNGQYFLDFQSKIFSPKF